MRPFNVKKHYSPNKYHSLNLSSENYIICHVNVTYNFFCTPFRFEHNKASSLISINIILLFIFTLKSVNV